MENVLEFIKTNLNELIVAILLLFILFIYVLWQIKKKGLKPLIVEFIIKAEDSFKQGENKEKMDFVIDKIITLIPLPFSLFVTRDILKNIIQKVFDEIKQALDYQPFQGIKE